MRFTFGEGAMPQSHASRSVDRLLGLIGNDFFVATCYWWILHREPDPSGSSHYLSRVIAGQDRLLIAAEIASSDEAQALPHDKKSMIGEILRSHASAMISSAWTPAKRAKAARRTQRYFEVVLGSKLAATESGSLGSSGAGDPFEDYLNRVINDRAF